MQERLGMCITYLLFSFYRPTSSYDCSNPIYGQTVNPHNLQKTSGGSSGGEGALIGGGGSLLGIGSDIGGSIRIPSAFCGICGFKPTTGRIRSVCLCCSVLFPIIARCLSWISCVLVSSRGVIPIVRGQKTGALQLYHHCQQVIFAEPWILTFWCVCD